MYKFASVFILLCITLFVCITETSFSQSKYKNPDRDQVASLINSTTRSIVNLGGSWEASSDNNNWAAAWLPGVSMDVDRIYLRRTIKIDKNLLDQHTWQLYFLGVDEDIEIYFNEQFVGKYLGGMTPFKVDIPKRFFRGEVNNIKFIVSRATGASRKIKEQNIYARKFYTGILREFFLIGNPNVFVNNIHYSTSFHNQSWDIRARVNIATGDISNFFTHSSQNDSLHDLGISKTSVQIEGYLRNKITGQQIAYYPPKTIEVEPFRNVALDIQMTANSPSLWSPDNPNLYQLTFKVLKNAQLIDDYTVNMGFASYYTQNIENISQIMLNGKRLIIKGVDYIEDFVNGSPVSFKKMEQDINFIKMNLGANLIRIKYGPPHPYLADLCDRYGLLLLIELPVYDAPQVLTGLDEIKVMMQNLAERYVELYSNNPSVVAFGIYDGVSESQGMNTDYLRKITGIFKGAKNKLIYKTVRFGANYIDKNSTDFICLRDNRKHNSIDNIRNEISRLAVLAGNMPVMVNYGYPIQPDNHNGYSDPLSIEAQSYYILNIYHVVKNKNLAGSIISTYSDYYLHNPLLMTNNRLMYLSSSGLIDNNGKQRLSLTTVRALFNGEKEPQLNAGSYSEEIPLSFIILGILVSILVVYYLNRFKRTREYFIRAFLRPYNFFADIRDQRIISNLQTFVLGLIISLTIALYLSSILFYYRSETITQLVLLLLIPYRTLQEFFFSIVWMPEVLLIILTIFFSIVFIIIAMIIRLFAIIVKSRIYLKDTFTIVIWSMAPIIILLPFSIILIRLLLFSPSFFGVTMILFLAVFIWVLFRMIKAVGVVFDTNPSKTYVVGFTVTIIIFITILSIYQVQYSIFDYTEFILSSLVK